MLLCKLERCSGISFPSFLLAPSPNVRDRKFNVTGDKKFPSWGTASESGNIFAASFGSVNGGRETSNFKRPPESILFYVSPRPRGDPGSRKYGTSTKFPHLKTQPRQISPFSHSHSLNLSAFDYPFSSFHCERNMCMAPWPKMKTF